MVDYALHCVWRQATPLPVPEQGQQITCPIPDALIDNVRGMARDNPDLPVTIWVDIYGLGNNAERLMQELNNQETAPNIKFKALDKIPAYASHPLYKKPFDGFNHYGANIWEQLDLARLHVVHHILTHDKGENVIYADMDIDFAHAGFKQALNTLKTTGTVVALTAPDGVEGLENSFFGLSQKTLPFLEKVLLPAAESMADEDIGTGNGDQYIAFISSFDAENAGPYGVVRADSEVRISELPNSRAIKNSYQKPAP